MKLNLKRPLAIFDLETTGTNPSTDRIIELSVIKVFTDGNTAEFSQRINPGIPIPPASTAVHHITDSDVADKPSFAQIADNLLALFDGCDIAGYNSNKFDVPLLMEEFKRAGRKFETGDKHFVDVQNIFYAMEPRTLTAAYRFYCGKELNDAHSAMGDTRATYEVLMGQLDKYEDLPNDIEQLSRIGQKQTLDLAGRIALNENREAVYNFGKYKGRKVEEIFQKDPGYYSWMMQGEFPQNTKDIMTRLYYNFKHKKQSNDTNTRHQ